MAINLNEVHHGNCLEIMNGIEDKSVSLIICDLPYGQTKNKWDSVLDLNELWKHYNRILKDNGAVILFGQGMFTEELMASNKKMWRYNLIWEKGRPTGFLNAKRMPLRSHEDIVVFYKKLPTYNPQRFEGKAINGKGTKYLTKDNIKNNNYGKIDLQAEFLDDNKGNTLKYPRSVIKDVDLMSEKEMKDYISELEFLLFGEEPSSVLHFEKPHPPIHPTQKPTRIYSYLIKTFSNEGDIVLDNCSGSGTLALACLETNRNFICIENEEEYVEMSNKRIQEYKEKMGTE